MKKLSLVVLSIAAFLFSSCSTHKVSRVDTKESIDLSGRWNDTDSRMVAEEMVNQVLGGGWISNFQTDNRNNFV